MLTELHIGIDDTDSFSAGCTTYVGAKLVASLSKLGLTFIDYPNIVRLNPNIPWKTRGNGAVCLRLLIPEDMYEKVRELTISCVERNSDLSSEGADPGIVFLRNHVPEGLKIFSMSALTGIVKMGQALKALKAFHGEAVGINGGRGIIGALAAIGEKLDGDHTYEAIAYRLPENRGKPRKVNPSSVVEMDRLTKPFTFNNLDPETCRVLITPRGLDPVLFGVRGENAEAVINAMRMVRVGEEIERWVVFRTNHGTDAHLGRFYKVSEIRPFSSVVVEGYVSKPPRTITGGHVIFKLSDETGEVDCAAYEPTGCFRDVVKSFIAGDRVRVYGGLRKAPPLHPPTINLEKVEVLGLSKKIDFINPSCPRCGKRMGSMGFNKGFRCERCGYRDAKLGKVALEVPRNIKRGLYITPPRAHRHLTKPLTRYGLEKRSRIGFSKEILPGDFWGLAKGFQTPTITRLSKLRSPSA